MKLQKNTKRLYVLIAATCVVAVGIATTYGVLKRRSVQRAMAQRAAGMTAASAGEKLAALNNLGPYLIRYPNDMEALAAYAKVRKDLPEANQAHLGQAVGFYRQLSDLAPQDAQYRHTLLELYDSLALNTEAVDLSSRMIEAHDAYPALYRLRARALYRLRKQPEALAAAQSAVAADPEDIQSNLLVMSIMQAQGTPTADICRQYEKLQKQKPNDACLAALLSRAYAVAGKMDESRGMAQRAAGDPVNNVETARFLTQHLDDLEMYPLATTTLQNAAQALKDPQLAEDLETRQFYLGQYERVVADASKQELASDSEILALRVLSLIQLGKTEAAQQAVKALDDRAARVDYVSGGWANVLRTCYLTPKRSDRDVIKVCREALAHDSHNAIFLLQLGQAYSRMGEKATALEMWNSAVQMAPIWPQPKILAAQVLHEGRQDERAVALARQAQKVAPDDKELLVTLAQSWAGTLRGTVSPSEPQALLKLVDEIQTRYPGEERTLPLQVNLLVKLSRRSDAIARAEALIGAAPPPSERALFQLADVSRELGLGLEEACFAASEKAYGSTANLAFARAVQLFKQDKKTEAVAYLDKMRAAQPADAWTSVWAQFLDVAGDPRAREAWVKLGDAAPDNSDVQWLALNSPSARQDHAFTGRTLQRLEALNGDTGLVWRLTKASWLLEDTGSKDSLDQATMLLTDVTRSAPDVFAPRLLLAQAYERSGNTTGAIEQLAVAADLAPNANEIHLELARLLIGHSESIRAMQYLKHVAENANTTPAQKRLAASLLISQGEDKLARTLLEQAGPAGDANDLTLADLCWKQGDLAQAERLYRRMLEHPTAPVIEQAAMFLAAQGQQAESEKTLSMLDQLKLEPGMKDLILGSYRSRSGQIDQGITLLRSAVKAAPAQVAAHRNLIGSLLIAGRKEETEAAVADALPILGADRLSQWIARNHEGFARAMDDPARRIFMISAMLAPPDDAVMRDVTEVLGSIDPKDPQTLDGLRQVADRYPRQLPLQVLMVQEFMVAGKTNESITWASRAMLTFPDASEPASFATAALASMGRWGEALSAAMRWRERSPKDTMQPDIMIAMADLGLQRPGDAIAQLASYRERALADPDRYHSVLQVYLQALLIGGKTDQAGEIIWPLAARDSKWRLLCGQLILGGISDVQLTKSWLQRLTDLCRAGGSGSVDDGLMVGSAWDQLGRRIHDPACVQSSRAVFTELLSRPGIAPKLAATINLSLGASFEQEGNLPQAESYYRHTLELDSTQTIARNNLAMVLTNRGGNLDEAAALAKQAVAEGPKVANYYDTLAFVQAKQKNLGEGVNNLKKAVAVEPVNPLWRIRLAETLLEMGDSAQAKTAVSELEAMTPDRNSLPEALRDRYSRLRDTLKMEKPT